MFYILFSERESEFFPGEESGKYPREDNQTDHKIDNRLYSPVCYAIHILSDPICGCAKRAQLFDDNEGLPFL